MDLPLSSKNSLKERRKLLNFSVGTPSVKKKKRQSNCDSCMKMILCESLVKHLTFIKCWLLLKCCWYSTTSPQSVWLPSLESVSMPEALSSDVEGSFNRSHGNGEEVMLPWSCPQSMRADSWCIYSPVPTEGVVHTGPRVSPVGLSSNCL